MSELTKHQIKIYYNPFLKEIAVERLNDEGQWKKWKEDPNENWGTLSDIDCQNIALQNVASELLQIINDKYNTGKNGMHIEFFGTVDDFNDLKDTMARMNKNGALSTSIKLTYNQENTLPIGEDAKRAVDSHYEKIKEIIDASNIDSVKKKVGKYQEIAKPRIRVCIIGNYSTGKSTFLNAMLGREILPSDTDPSTAKNVNIYHSKEMCMSFDYNKEKVSIIWRNDIYRYSEAGSTELKSILDKNARKETDAFRQVHAILKTLNELSDEKLASDIELKLPFANEFFTTSEVEYIFIDTPGSNAAAKRSEKHKETLVRALKDQTSALPVILVDRNSLFSNDNEALDVMLQKADIELDIPNKLFVINMADKINVPTLNKDLDNDIYMKTLKEKHVEFVIYFSALIALGAQTDLCDASYQADYKKNKCMFTDDTDGDFRNLEQYAILPDLLSEIRYSSDSSDETDICLKNSGMLLFQRALNNFAKKYSYYSKAEACRKLLLEAVQEVDKEQDDLLDEQTKMEECHIKERDKKRKELIKEIEEIKKKLDFDNNFTDIVNQAQNKFNSKLKPFLEGLTPEVSRQWDTVKNEKIKGSEKTTKCHEQVVKKCNVEYKRLSEEVIDFYENKFHNLAEEYKKHIISLIKSDEQLSKETKKRLIHIDIKKPIFLPTYTDYKFEKKAFSKAFIFWGEKIDPKTYSKTLKEDFEACFLLDCVNKPSDDFKKELNKWVKELQVTYISGIDRKSITLKAFDEKIAICKEKNEAIEQIRKDLTKSKKELEIMMRFKMEVL